MIWPFMAGRLSMERAIRGFMLTLAFAEARSPSSVNCRHSPRRRRFMSMGLIVAPGFIDMHSHSDTLLLEDGLAQSKIRQGVTTEVLGEGSSAGPRVGQLKPQSMLVGGQPTTWSTLGEYFQTIEKAGISVNVASYIGLDNAWQAVMGQSYDRPTKEQFAEMQKVIDQAMQDGAFGLSSMLAMPPGSLATTDDIVLLCEPVKKHGGLFSTHNRNEGTGVFDAIREAIAVGEKAGVPVDIIHVKIADQQYWGRMKEIIDLINAARSRGVNVQTNIYPYTRGNNNLSSIVPPWAHEGGKSQMLARLKDPKEREKMKRDIRGGIAGWYNHYTAVGGDWSRMLISGRSQYEGQTMDRVIALRTRGQNPHARQPRRAFRSIDRRRRLRPDRLCPSHRRGHEPGPRSAVVLDRQRRLRLFDRRRTAPRQSASAEFRHISARPGRLCPRAEVADAGRCRPQDDKPQCQQARPERPRLRSGGTSPPTSASSIRRRSSTMRPIPIRSSTTTASNMSSSTARWCSNKGNIPARSLVRSCGTI